MRIFEILKMLREEEGLSQQKLANLTGISQSSIARWELGNSEPNAEAVIKLADFFEVSTDDLLGRKNVYTQIDYRKTRVQELFEQLDIGEQSRVLGYMEGLLEQRGINIKRKSG
jgi:transcriptional regulator with XRE-family HTH domain